MKEFHRKVKDRAAQKDNDDEARKLEISKRSGKNKPVEMSSRRPVTRFRQVVDVVKKVSPC